MGRRNATGPDGLRLCSICKSRKPLTEFYLCKRTRNGVVKQEPYAYCRPCEAARNLSYYENHKNEKKEYQEKNREHKIKYLYNYRKSNPERAKKQAHENYVNNRTPEMAKRANLQYLFKISLEEYNAMLGKQGGVCAICGNPEQTFVRNSTKIKVLAVDHDHKTNKIRGLLCRGCNVGLGHFGDDVSRIRLAIRYLESYTVSSK